MSKTREEYWMEEAQRYEGWFNRANYMRVEQEADNVALRKLVRDMVDYGEGAGNGMAEFFADRLRELGIEVDG